MRRIYGIRERLAVPAVIALSLAVAITALGKAVLTSWGLYHASMGPAPTIAARMAVFAVLFWSLSCLRDRWLSRRTPLADERTQPAPGAMPPLRQGYSSNR